MDISEKDLGYAGMVEEVKIGDDEMVFVRECKEPKAVTILVRGGTEHIVDEVERVIDDSLGVVISAIIYRKVIAGAGASEVETARVLRDYAKSVGGREQLAIEAFADAMEVIPKALAENAGLDPIDVLVELRTKHEENRDIGYNVMTKRLENMIEAGLITPTNVKTQAIDSASEVAVMILRIDDVIAASGLGKGGAGEGGF
ncbi:60 kDa chaperonin [archaeon BMS3Bbin15]|nr:60 kDa chaperonin [archaeon BMS3Bbin15]